MVTIEELKELLSEAILWHDTVDLVLKSEQRNPEVRAKLQQSYPRVLYEASFFLGNPLWYAQALAFDPALNPEQISTIAVTKVIEKKKGEFNFDYHDHLTLTKSPEYVEWQRWRGRGLSNAKYPHQEFPHFLEETLVYINGGVGRSRTNYLMENGRTGKLEVVVNNHEKVLSWLVTEQRDLPDICGHRYEYELLFDRLVPEEVAEQIMGVPFQANK